MNNINSGNLPVEKNNNVTFFNNYVLDTNNISENLNDAIIAYFEGVTGDRVSGKTLAATVIYTAISQGLDPMAMVDEFRSMKRNELTAYLTMFLNLNRVNTSLLGINTSPQTSKYVLRTILP